MGAVRTAVVGVGQTRHVSARHDVSMAGLVREAALEALEDAGLDFGDIDAVVVGKAPDMFEGVIMPELYLADALGAVGKPMLRVHTAGSVGGSTAIVAAKLVMAGVHKRVADRRVREAVREQRDLGPLGADAVPARRSSPAPAATSRRSSARTSRRSGAPEHIGHLVSVKDRLNALRNPRAQLHLPDIDLKTVQESMLLWAPLRLLDVCPSSDGAMAMVIGARGRRRRRARTRPRGSTAPRCAASRRCSPVATR